MPNGPRLLLDNISYYVVVRGNQKQRVFRDTEDCKEYLKRLCLYKRKHNFQLYGFCLMPNHVHLLGEVVNKKNLSTFMHDLSRSYTSYFNEKYRKVGHLWQGRFVSRIVTKDKYF